MSDNTDEKGKSETVEVALSNGDVAEVRSHLSENGMQHLGQLLKEQAALMSAIVAAVERSHRIDLEVVGLVTVDPGITVDHLQQHPDRLGPADIVAITTAFYTAIGWDVMLLARSAAAGLRGMTPAGG